MTKLQKQKRLVAYTESELTKIGATKGEGRQYLDTFFEFNTSVGKLFVKVSEDRLRRGQDPTVTVFTKFDSPQMAINKVANINRWSGKWNHHFLLEENVNYVLYQIDRLLPETEKGEELNND